MAAVIRTMEQTYTEEPHRTKKPIELEWQTLGETRRHRKQVSRHGVLVIKEMMLEIKMEDENRKTRDEERKREQQERKSRDIVQQIPLWDDKTDEESHSEVFEVSMKEAMQSEDQWVPILRKRLTSKALATYQEICPTSETIFSELKTDTLKRIATVESARNVIWLQKVRPDDNLELCTKKKLMVSINRLKNTWRTPEDAAHESFHGVLHRIFNQETLLLLRDEVDDSSFRKTEKLRNMWSSRDLYGRQRMLRAEQQSYSHQQPRHKDWSADKLHPPSVVEGEPSGRDEVGSGFSGWAWGGSRGARPLPNTRDKSQMTCFN